MGPTASQQSSAEAAEVGSRGGGVFPRQLGRFRAGLLLVCGGVTLVGLHALAAVLFDWPTVAYGLVFGAALAGIWIWTTGTRRLVSITIAAVVSVAAREALLPMLEGTGQVLGIVAGITLSALDVRELEFWRRLRSANRVVEWPTWRVFRPNVYMRLLTVVPVLLVLGFFGWRYAVHVRHERLMLAIIEYGGSAGVAQPPDWWEDLGLGWSYGEIGQVWLVPHDFHVRQVPRIADSSASRTESSNSRGDERLDAIIRQVGQSPSLWRITILRPDVSDDAFTSFGSAHALSEVVIKCPRVGDRGAAFLADLPLLKSLDLSDTAVTGKFLTSQANLPRLELLTLNNTRFADTASADLRQLRKLWFLDLRHTPITDAALVEIGQCLSLKYLDLSHTDVSDAGVQHLTGLSLSVLKLDGCSVTIDGVAPICQATNLFELSLAGTDLSAGDLSRLTGVYELNVSGATLGGGALEELAQINTLTRLDLSATDVRDDDVETLRRYPNFGSLSAAPGGGMTGATPPGAKTTRLPRGVLSLRSTRITDESLTVLGSLKCLRSIDLSDTAVTDNGVRHLADMPHLDDLNLANTAVTDATLHRLHGLARLNILDVTDTQVTATGVDLLQQAKPHMTINYSVSIEPDEIPGDITDPFAEP